MGEGVYGGVRAADPDRLVRIVSQDPGAGIVVVGGVGVGECGVPVDVGGVVFALVEAVPATCAGQAGGESV